MIVVRSEDGTFLGEVRTVQIIGIPNQEGLRLVANLRIVSEDNADYDLLATYKTKEAAIKQIDDMKKYRDHGIRSTYDLSEYKIED